MRAPEAVLRTLPFLSLLGLAGLAANLALGFEEPNGGMLLGSALLLALAPVGMLLHLAVSRELSPQERSRWFQGLRGRHGAALFASYFDARARERATRRLAEAGRKPS